MAEVPRDLEAEKMTLACVLLDEPAIHTVDEMIEEGDYFDDRHRVILRAMRSMEEERVAIDLLTLKSELERRGDMEKAGGIVYLAGLTDGVPRGTNIRHYCSIVREKAVLRKIMTLAHGLHSQAARHQESPRTLIETAQSSLLDLYARYQSEGLRHISEIASEGFQDLEARRASEGAYGLQTGFRDIDQILGGMRPGNLIILAARPACGKTALAVSIGINVAKAGKRVAVFSLEMGATELYYRILGSEGQLQVSRLLGGGIAKRDWAKIAEVTSSLCEREILIDDSGGITMAQLSARCRRAKMEGGLDLVVVDYLQLIQGTGRTIYESVTRISRELKLLAKDLRIPIIVLSQLHRLDHEAQEPQLSDLRESGAIEQDADVVMFLWPSEDEWSRNGKIAKQRNGPTGRFELGFAGDETRFFDLTRRQSCDTER